MDQPTDLCNDRIPENFPVAVLMEQRPSVNDRWSEFQWQALGVSVGTQGDASDTTPRLVRDDGVIRQYLHPGLTLTLYQDECESYYHNLTAPKPSCYIVTREEEDGVPEPFLVSLSFDEAHAYLEGDDTIYAVDIPPELYRWTELFVLANYAPEKRRKRKRDNWKSAAAESRGRGRSL